MEVKITVCMAKFTIESSHVVLFSSIMPCTSMFSQKCNHSGIFSNLPYCTAVFGIVSFFFDDIHSTS